MCDRPFLCKKGRTDLVLAFPDDCGCYGRDTSGDEFPVCLECSEAYFKKDNTPQDVIDTMTSRMAGMTLFHIDD